MFDHTNDKKMYFKSNFLVNFEYITMNFMRLANGTTKINKIKGEEEYFGGTESEL